MHLIQLLLPLYDNEGNAFPAEALRAVGSQLIDRFGGVTAYGRAPAEGFWDDGGHVQRDQLLVYEVMVESLKRDWWAALRKDLEQRFRQDEIVIRAQAMERL